MMLQPSIQHESSKGKKGSSVNDPHLGIHGFPIEPADGDPSVLDVAQPNIEADSASKKRHECPEVTVE